MVFKPSAACGSLRGFLNGIVTGVPITAGSELIELFLLRSRDRKHRRDQIAGSAPAS